MKKIISRYELYLIKNFKVSPCIVIEIYFTVRVIDLSLYFISSNNNIIVTQRIIYNI